jgi:signal recognition particle subunit SRP54
VLDNVSSSFRNAFKKLGAKGLISATDIDDVLADIRIALVDSDVNVHVIDEFLEDVRAKCGELEYSKSVKPQERVIKIIHDELVEVLGHGVERKLNRAKSGPTVIMLIGLQGAGKTTLAGKLAHYFKKNKHTPLLVAADLQRPGAVSQLEIVGERAGVEVYAPNKGVDAGGSSAQEKSGLFAGLLGGKDSSKEPIKVATGAVDYAKQKMLDTVIIDTAGRLGVDEELMKQAKGIADAVNPDEVLFVLDSTTGSDAVNSAKAFDDNVGFSASVLTKFDSDARGGAALSVVKTTGKPILFASVGEKLEDLEVFHPDRVASRILDQGDVLTLLEQAEEKLDTDVLESSVSKLIAGEAFDLNDFLVQMQQIKKMGSVKSLLGMLPGMGANKDMLENFDESILGQTEAIIQSMTPFERANPKRIDGSRKGRIARGAGVEVSAVNSMLTKFTQMQKMMSSMTGKSGKKRGSTLPGGLKLPKGLDLGKLQDMVSNPGAADESDITDVASIMKGMGINQPGGFGNSRPQVSRKKGRAKGKKAKSGNPAKRAAQEALLRAKFGG